MRKHSPEILQLFRLQQKNWNPLNISIRNNMLMNNNVKISGWFWNPEKLVVVQQYSWICPINIHKTWQSSDGLFIISGNKWTINVGFQFNNATGVPSGPIDHRPNLPVQSLTDQPVYILWTATIWHDAGYTYMDEPEFPFSRLQIDQFLKDNMNEINFKWSKLYYWGVRKFGGIAHFINNVSKQISKIFHK